MKKVLPRDMLSQAGPPSSVVLATCVDRDGNPNIITLGMFMNVSIDPPMVCIGVAPERYSHDLIKEQGEFAVNVPTTEIIDEMHSCGITSGRDCDKFASTGLTPIPAQRIRSPLIKECYGHLECRVVQAHTCGDHTLFVGEVVAASVDEEVLENSRLVLTKAKPVVQKNWVYHTVKLPQPFSIKYIPKLKKMRDYFKPQKSAMLALRFTTGTASPSLHVNIVVTPRPCPTEGVPSQPVTYSGSTAEWTTSPTTLSQGAYPCWS